jgi:hypothetical protein
MSPLSLYHLYNSLFFSQTKRDALQKALDQCGKELNFDKKLKQEITSLEAKLKASLAQLNLQDIDKETKVSLSLVSLPPSHSASRNLS